MTDLAKKPYRKRGTGAMDNGYLLHIKDGVKTRVHRKMVEDILGKKLPRHVEIHHIDEDRSNNANNNLVVCQDHSYHMLLHTRTKAYDACGNANWLPCRYCKEYDDKVNMHVYYNPCSQQTVAHHVRCANADQRSRRAKKCFKIG